MKLINRILLSALAALSLASCDNDSIDPLSGKYPIPSDFTSESLSDGGRTEGEDGLFIFSVVAQDLNLQFVSMDWSLPAGDYYISDIAKSGTVLTASSYGDRTVDDGALTVKKEGDTYLVSGVVWLSDDSVLRINASGVIIYEPVVMAAQFYYTLAEDADPLRAAKGFHVMTITDLDGKAVANLHMVYTDSPIGTFSVSTDMDNIGVGQALAGNAFYLLFGSNLGTFFFDGGVQYFVGAGNLVISGSEEMYNVEINSMSAADGDGKPYSGSDNLSLRNIAPAPPVTDEPGATEDLEIKGGTCSIVSAPKDDVEGVTEHTFSFSDAEGKPAGQFVCWTATDAAYTGFYGISDSAKAGSFSIGMSLFGMFDLGSYYYKEGKIYYITGADLAIVAEEDGKVGILISGVKSSDASGADGLVANLSFSDMVIAQ